MKTTSEDDEPIEVAPHTTTLAKGLRVLILIGESMSAGLTLSEVAKLARLHISTASRHLSTLQALAFVTRDSDGRYQLGSQALHIGAIAMSNSELRDVASPFLSELVHATSETAHLAVLDGSDVIYIDKVDSPQAVRMWSAVGSRLPTYCSAAGKAILAHLPEKALRTAIVSPLEKRTPHTITHIDDLFEDLNEIRIRGFAIDDCENRSDIRCVAAPVFNRRREVVGSISVSAPSARVSLELARDWGELVSDTARAICERLGGNPAAHIA